MASTAIPEKRAYEPAKNLPANVLGEAKGPMPDRIMAAFSYESIHDSPTYWWYPAMPASNATAMKAAPVPRARSWRCNYCGNGATGSEMRSYRYKFLFAATVKQTPILFGWAA